MIKKKRKKRRHSSIVKKKIAVLVLSLSACVGITIYTSENVVKSSVSSLINQTFDTNLNVVLPEYKEVVDLDIASKFKSIKDINNDTIAWLSVENTNIDYPVMFRDNQTYLYHNYNHEYNFSGSIFMDESCSSDLNGIILLHGHDMLDGTMFGSLPKLINGNIPKDSKIEFYDGTQIVQYQIFSMFYYSIDDMLINTRFLDKESYKQYLSKLASLGGTTIDSNYEGNVIVMSTCTDAEGPGRIAICAKRV